MYATTVQIMRDRRRQGQGCRLGMCHLRTGIVITQGASRHDLESPLALAVGPHDKPELPQLDVACLDAGGLLGDMVVRVAAREQLVSGGLEARLLLRQVAHRA